ncbi:hypothetical protein [Tropicimonas sp. IMCC6043]|uniref:hypothetical protein n=1 Tax=Tropicimonas sp. IMCC6043 TaxID=2510645 RepID=UPI00101C2A44|nr:hypothetical protein [Tropicimonas sp. IMCC6043]RYH12314.1 hypothetical protein EU800_01785 [Tropicimonas sp. IMCC6043]
MRATLFLPLLAIPLVAGCVEESATMGVPSPAEQACLRDVARDSSNPAVRVQSSSFSEAGTEVIVLVGEDGGVYPPAPWRCIAYSDGTTAGIEYVGGGEGAL